MSIETLKNNKNRLLAALDEHLPVGIVPAVGVGRNSVEDDYSYSVYLPHNTNTQLLPTQFEGVDIRYIFVGAIAPSSA